VIININSLAGKSDSPGEAVYAASKHGLRGFSSCLQYDATRDGVTVLDVYLGGMQTDMTKGREGWGKLINPAKAADVIYSLGRKVSTLRITEAEIRRRRY
jgi:short-subunit dehydrogenase